ncbi:MAG: hypothetical protein MUF49_02840 [Oculatellaceae cyanobacterium Prado106]|jgi:hypothetical protein|nr:hypothetical protein [Oculatellaceae cyanobacterium Prado106]
MLKVLQKMNQFQRRSVYFIKSLNFGRSGSPFRQFCRFLIAILFAGLLHLGIASGFLVGISQTAQGQSFNQANLFTPNCQLTSDAIAQTTAYRQTALQGEPQPYRDWLQQLAPQLQQCRRQTWPQTQAIWLRLYPCDVKAGRLDDIFDRILSRGYNQVYLEVFSDGQVLLPKRDNPTAWESVVQIEDYAQRDLLAEAIARGRLRGMRVYAWMFALNFGYRYSLRPDADQILARNGRGQTSLSFSNPESYSDGAAAVNETFVDPYSVQAQADYQVMLREILKRRPDGILFDYIRYPRGVGSATVVSRVEDLWIYGAASQAAFLQRAINNKGRELLQRYLTQGRLTTADLTAINTLYPQEKEPLWEGRSPSTTPPTPLRVESLQAELWQLSLKHAAQGILNFLQLASQTAQQQGISPGAVFFPYGNQTVGSGGFDARLQPWDQFPNSIEWHPMAYSTCSEVSCIMQEIQRVLNQATAGTQVIPALAGTWNNWFSDHPPLEWQMSELRRNFPQVNAVSHFAFSWQETELERDRQFCEL